MTSRKPRKKVPDDLRHAKLTRGASFDGIFEMPIVYTPRNLAIPKHAIPFSKRFRSKDKSELLVFNEFDNEFSDVLENPDDYLEELRSWPMILGFDCSLYRDATLGAQFINTYESRLVSSYLQRKGVNLMPFVRFGDERSYTTCVLPEPFALMGLEHGSPFAVGPYGCFKSNADKEIFLEGLAAAIDFIEPPFVVSYGNPKRKEGFASLDAEIIFLDDFETRVRGHRG